MQHCHQRPQAVFFFLLCHLPRCLQMVPLNIKRCLPQNQASEEKRGRKNGKMKTFSCDFLLSARKAFSEVPPREVHLHLIGGNYVTCSFQNQSLSRKIKILSLAWTCQDLSLKLKKRPVSPLSFMKKLQRQQ